MFALYYTTKDTVLVSLILPCSKQQLLFTSNNVYCCSFASSDHSIMRTQAAVNVFIQIISCHNTAVIASSYIFSYSLNKVSSGNSSNNRRWRNVGSMLGQRLRRRTNIEPTVVWYLVCWELVFLADMRSYCCLNLHKLTVKALDHSMYVSDFCTPVASISVISAVISGSRCFPLFVHSGLLFSSRLSGFAYCDSQFYNIDEGNITK